MSKPPGNMAHRNAMTDYERNIYDMGWAEAERNIVESLKSRRCSCLDLTIEEWREKYPEPEDTLRHMNHDFVGLDWVIEFIQGETE